MRRTALLALVLFFAGCGGLGDGPHAHATGQLDLASFPAPPPDGVEALSSDGERRQTALAADGRFDLPLTLEKTWSFRVTFSSGGGYPLALARDGHFDRALVADGRVAADLGTVWLPPAGSDVTRVPESDAARCVAGRLDSGAPCAVLEALTSCADGPTRPTDDPTSLLLGTGTLGELPGAARGVRYALPSHVPPPILWECPPAPVY
ncbi:MAG: hypothetical protein ACOZQL_34595 [Myxococcota bacterium]